MGNVQEGHMLICYTTSNVRDTISTNSILYYLVPDQSTLKCSFVDCFLHFALLTCEPIGALLKVAFPS